MEIYRRYRDRLHRFACRMTGSAELARDVIPRVETLPAGASDLPIQDVRVTDLPPYRNQWETVAGGWSFEDRSVPGMEVRE